MSSTVRSYGFVAVLNEPLSKGEREELSEKLYDSQTGLNINYEGTLVYIDFNEHEDYSVRGDIYTLDIGDTTQKDQSKFNQALIDFGLSAVHGTIQPYSEIWWNGSDSCINMLTVKQYLEIINKE